MSDLKFALRMLVREPSFTVVSVIVLALGIGATTAIFTLIHALLIQPLAYPDSARLVWIAGSPPKMNPGSASLLGADFLEIRDRNHSFQETAALIGGAWIITSRGDAETIQGARVTPRFFETLGISPMLGRSFLPEEHWLGHEMEVVYTYPFWQRRFRGDPAIIGQHVIMDGVSFEVVGVLPPGFPMEADYEMFAPLQMDSTYARGRTRRLARAFGRLRPGVSLAQAQSEMDAFAADFARRFSNDKGYGIKLATFLDREVGNVRGSLWIFAGAVLCVLLITCSNAASLLLARGAARMREMAVRAAIGASRAALIRQMLVESGMLALLGGALGLALAAGTVRLLLNYDPRVLPRASEIHVDPAVLSFTVLISLLTGILFGIAPALRASRVSLAGAAKDGGHGASAGRSGNRLRKVLVIVEVALGVVLTATAGLLTRSLQALASLDPGYRVQNVLTLQLAAMGSKYRDMEECRKFYQNLVKSVSEMPAVESVSTTNWLPLQSDRNYAGVWPDTEAVQNEQTKIFTDNRVIAPGYFRTMGVPILEGRDFDWTDRPESQEVVIVNDVFAREFFAGGKAMGHVVTMDIGGTHHALRVIGISGSFRELSLADPPRREIFTPYMQTTIAGETLVVRTRDDAARHVTGIRELVAAVDPNVPIYRVRTMQDQVDRSLAQFRLRRLLITIFSAAALLLAALGVYGVIACAVAERQREIGIRMALGANHGQVRRLVAGQALVLTAAGLIIGLTGATAATRLLRGFLYGVGAGDPLTYAFTGAMFFAVALVATYVPARRATAVDPVAILKD